MTLWGRDAGWLTSAVGPAGFVLGHRARVPPACASGPPRKARAAPLTLLGGEEGRAATWRVPRASDEPVRGGCRERYLEIREESPEKRRLEGSLAGKEAEKASY